MCCTSDYLLAAGAPDDIAVVDGGSRHTYAELRFAAARLAGELSALALPAGSRVGILGPNSLFWIAGYLAVLRLGHVAVPFPDRLPADDLRRNAELVGCRAVLADRRSLRRYPTAALGPGTAIVTDEALVRDGGTCRPEGTVVDPDADAVLLFTSGTTSRPKAVRITHRNIRANTEAIVEYLGLRPDDRVLVILPFSYCFGASLLHTHLRVGARVVLCNSFVFPETAVELMDREECTVFAGVPSSFQLLLRAGSFASRELPSLRIVQQAGGRLPEPLIDELVAAKPRAELFVMYGQTEATARLSYLPPRLLAEKKGSIGRGIPGVELLVLDEQGRRVRPGEQGEIYARGASISPGYLGDPDGSASKLTPHGLRTGDLGTVDEDGYVYVTGRRDDFVKSWGFRVSCPEVEACVQGLDGVTAVAAVGVPDDAAGEALVLVVVPRPGTVLLPGTVVAHCAGRLPKHMVPRAVRIVDALPLTPSGKVSRPALRELVRSGDEATGDPQPRRHRPGPVGRQTPPVHQDQPARREPPGRQDQSRPRVRSLQDPVRLEETSEHDHPIPSPR
ncbi:MAG: acyl--CoA ligase [Actinomycetales bacterium]|nr:acyl--CoA ligase [Actinomycetales bacterium]